MLYSVRAESFLWQDLLGQMSRIREKATESEAVVRDITKDIQVLDLAKKNLITSMTMMKRLQMLGSLPLPGVILFLSFLFSSQCIDTTGGLDQGEEVWRSCANFGGACLFTKRIVDHRLKTILPLGCQTNIRIVQVVHGRSKNQSCLEANTRDPRAAENPA